MWLTWQENLNCAPGLRPKSDHAMSTFAFLYNWKPYQSFNPITFLRLHEIFFLNQNSCDIGIYRWELIERLG